jgi:hypothetical protein
MRDILKELNDRNPSEIEALDERGLRRFEVLCESWAKIAEAELARRKTLPTDPLTADRHRRLNWQVQSPPDCCA